MRGLRRLALVLGLAQSACGASTSTSGTVASPPTNCAQVYALLRLTPSQIQQEESAGRCVHPNLAVSGELQGRVRAAQIDQPCSRLQRGDGLPSDFYDFALAGALYTLRLNPVGKPYDRKPITIAAGGHTPAIAEVHQESAGATAVPRIWLATSGSFAADSTGTGGKLDLTLTRDVSGASPLRISGTWTCSGPMPPVTSPQPTGPCASAYAVATSPEDASSLHSGSCQTQDLTLAGTINGHISDAVVERVDQGLLAGSTDACGGDSHHFAMTLVTGVAGEEVTLGMKLATDPFTGQPLGTSDYGPMSQDVVPTPTVILHAGQTIWSSQSGTLSLDGSRTSGRLNMDLRGGVSGDQLVHLSGQWTCA